MSLFLGTVDKKKITGRQGRAVHKTSHLFPTCYFPEYGNNLRVEVDDVISNQLNLLSGCGLVDGTVVEENATSTITVNDPGDYKAYIEVNLSNDNNPTVSFGVTTSALIQDDLTINKNGIHQGELATFSFNSGVVSDLNNTLQNGDIVTVLNLVLDNRYKRVVDINNEFSNSDFDGMSMAQILQYINIYINTPWNHTFEIIGEVGATLVSNVYNAIKNLVEEMFNVTINITVCKFKINRPRRIGVSGCDILEIGFNNGPIYYIQYDNYGPNWQIDNNDAFKPLEGYFGGITVKGNTKVNGNMVTTGSTTTGTTHINGTANITGNMNLDGTAKVGGNVESDSDVSGQTVRAYNTSNGFILETKSSSQLSTIYPLVVKYLSGTFRTSLVETSDPTGQYNAFFNYDNTGTPNRVLRFYSSFTGGVLHTTPSASRKLAYESSLLLSQIESLENQVSLQSQIDDLKAPVEYAKNGVTKSNELLSLESKLDSLRNELNQLELTEELSHITTNIDSLRLSITQIDKSIKKLNSKLIFKSKQKINDLELIQEIANSKLDNFEDQLLDYWQGGEFK